MRLVRPWLLCGRVCVYAKGLIGDRCLYHRKGGKDRVLGEVKWYSHPLREEPPESPFQVGGGCSLVFVLDTSSLRHLFKLRLIRIEPPAFHHSLQPAQARQHALRARERGVCGSRWTRLCENVDRCSNLLHTSIHHIDWTTVLLHSAGSHLPNFPAMITN